MKYQYIKATQITIIGLYSIINKSLIPYLTLILLSYFPSTLHKFTTILCICSLLPNVFIQKQWIVQLILAIVLVGVGFFRSQGGYIQYRQYITPMYLFMIGLVSMSEHYWLRNCHLGLFFFVLLCRYIKFERWDSMVWAIRFLTCIQAGILYSMDYCNYSWFDRYYVQILIPNPWWHYLGYVGIIVVSELIKAPQGQIPQVVEGQMIELKQLNKDSKQINGKKSQSEKSNSVKSQKMEQVDLVDSRHEDQEDENNKNQSQIVNLLLIIPFTCFPTKLLEIPIYLYFTLLNYSSSNRSAFVFMLLSTFSITYINFQSQNLWLNLSLRCCMIFMVDKNFELAASFADAVRIVWLRGSFVIVLSVLFWFGLKTVNIFHLVFIIIVLLFITKSADKNKKSFRHRNWKYLVILFNIFLLTRYIYSLVRQKQWVKNIAQILSILGISFQYDDMPNNFFNLTPLIISLFICVQYWTYNSRIYQTNYQKAYFFSGYVSYRNLVEKLLDLITLLFYKLVPWLSYVIVIFPLVFFDYSISSALLLIWITLVLSIQILYQHSWSVHYRGWLVFERLTALLIILRYIFSFSTLQPFKTLLEGTAWFTPIVKNQQLLGFIIRDANFIYFKAISKFQLMISLNLGTIFISFLVNEYLNVVIRYHEINKLEQKQNQSIQQSLMENEDNKIKQIYENYIDFKIMVWMKQHNLSTYLSLFVKIFLKTYLVALGVYACVEYSVMMGLYLLVCLKFYHDKNVFFYSSYLGNMLVHKIRRLIKGEQLEHDTPSTIKERLIRLWEVELEEEQIKSHLQIRKYLIIISVIGIFLTNFSRFLFTKEVTDFLPLYTIQKLDWLLFVNGTNSRSSLHLFNFIFMMIIVTIQSKCCKFMSTTRQIINNQIPPAILNISQQKKYIDMQVSILFGINKLIERTMVVLLVFISILGDNNPFAIVYLICAWLLSSMGSVSTLSLSRLLFIIICLQYFSMVSQFTNNTIYSHAPKQFDSFRSNSLITQNFSPQWAKYLTFGDSVEQRVVLLMSFLLLSGYQIYFTIAGRNWMRIIKYLTEQMPLSDFQKRVYRLISSSYTYGLVYSPLGITVLCIGMYFMDYTATNFFLSGLSLIFVFKSFLVQEYTESRFFWKSYFSILQAFILFFMMVYCILTIPMNQKYCNKIFCSAEQFRTKVTKAILLLILQLGIDLIKSHHFESAMKKLKLTNENNSSFSRLAIAYKLNDRKIATKISADNNHNILKRDVNLVCQFLELYKKNPSETFDNPKQIIETDKSWLDVILELLPDLVDPILLMSAQEAEKYIRDQNNVWIHQHQLNSAYQLQNINESYREKFSQANNTQQFISIITKILKSVDDELQTHQRIKQNQIIKSNKIKSLESYDITHSILQSNIRESIRQIGDQPSLESVSAVENMQKKRMVYLLIFQAIISNWHYLTYVSMILLHLNNRGFLTVIFPILTFVFGIPHSYQAPKHVWMTGFAFLILPITVKYLIGMGIIDRPLQSQIVYLMIGNNVQSLKVQYLAILAILVECLILKIVGLYDTTVSQVECMKMALVRKIINNDREQERDKIIEYLKQSEYMSENQIQQIFSKAEYKQGYDYSTFLVSLQLSILIYVFIFYDSMVRMNSQNFNSMIDYNQFSAGMVIMSLVQLALILSQRFVAIADLKDISHKWQVSLIIKFSLLLLGMVLVHGLILIVFPLHFHTKDNFYVTVFYVLCSLYFLVSSLQVKYGIDHFSRGFMERYTWYNGYLYTIFRVIPFLFEFKVFSDWAVTKTSLRLFDWIKFEQIFGRLYVAKCNSLFLRGKILGSKIEGWKKFIMGYPLLIAIILLLFGPLILFSGLNPLASPNGIIGGYLQMTLRVNQTNEYKLYTNSHINNIHYYNQTIDELNSNERTLIETENIEEQDIQLISLQAFSDQYWQISEGSYDKLQQEPQSSSYEIFLRARFERFETGSTKVYTISSYQVPTSRVWELKATLQGQHKMKLENVLHSFIRLDNNNGLHQIGKTESDIIFYATKGNITQKKYWVIEKGIQFKVASDKYSSAIFGYSVMSFYISIILVIGNYFRFLFQGSAYTIIMSEIPNADPILRLCQAVYEARARKDILTEQKLFWTIIDLVRSPDTIKALTGDYLDARLETLESQKDSKKQK